MKKMFTVFAFVLFSVVIMNAQPIAVKHFGLKLMDVVTADTLVSTMSKYGTPVDLGQLGRDGVTVPYMFSNVTYEGRTYDLVSLLTLEDGTLVYVSYMYVLNSFSGKSDLTETYNSIADTLQTKYHMVEVEVNDQSISRIEDNNSVVTVRLDKIKEDGKMEGIELSYSLESLINLKRLSKALDDEFKRPDIQNTFLGMTLGEKYTSSQVKNALLSKGTFFSQEREGDGYSYTFTDVRFAGTIWDYASILTTQNNEFYYFCVYESWPDGYSNDDERKEAKRNFDSLKSRLDEKYGEVDIQTEEGNESAVYIGGNDIALQLSNKRSLSSGGTYRRYLELVYLHRGIVEQVNDSYDDEL